MSIASTTGEYDMSIIGTDNSRWTPMQATIQQRVENRLSNRGDSIFTIGENATVDSLLGLCAERFKQPVNGTTGLYTAQGTLLLGSSRLKSVVKPGESVYLQRKQEGDECLFGCNWLRCSVACFVAALIGIIVTSCVFALTRQRHPFDMGVVIDAGSSHSEAVIFEWVQPKTNGTGQAKEVDRVPSKKGGISSLTPDEAYEEYRTMLHETKKVIANYTEKPVVLYMSATAGMRLLNMEHPDRAAAIMARVREAMKESGFIYKKAEISDGEDEGAQGWVSINHILNRLSTDGQTLGALDLGGASTQITFEVGTKGKPTRSLRMYGKEYHLYSKSYLCFGLDQAYLRYMMTLLFNQTTFLEETLKIKSPCHCHGFKIEKKLSEILSPCVENNDLARLTGLLRNNTFTIEGEWNPAECRAMTSEVFDPSKCTARGYKECFTDVPDAVPMIMEFVAFSGFFFTASEANITSGDELQKLESAANAFCDLPYLEWLEKYYKNVRDYTDAGCFKINMIRALIVDKYKFTNEGFKRIQFTKKIEGQGVSWPMGLMLNATNALPEDLEVLSALSLGAYVLLIIFFALLLILSVVCFHLHRKADLRKVQGLMFASSIRAS